MMIVQHHEAAYFTRKCIDTFERYYEEGAERPKIMAIAIHPYISGQPFRIKYLEQVYARISQDARRAALERRADPRLVFQTDRSNQPGA